jgi:probable F420-dependent oxidoreductase
MEYYFGLPANRSRTEEFVTGASIAKVARSAEELGFTGIFATDHPFASVEFLDSGSGQHTLDPFVALAVAASATSTIKILTYVCVLPYRNPFLLGKAAASLQAVSDGRLILGVGSGHLKAEFQALGVDFAQRGNLLDEGLVALRRAWAEDSVEMRGLHFEASGNTLLPRLRSIPPIWVGGNSNRAIQRAVQIGDGWVPMVSPRVLGDKRRSAFLENLEDLTDRLAYLHEVQERGQSTRPITVIVTPMVPSNSSQSDYDRHQLLDHLMQLEELGVEGVAFHTLEPDLQSVLSNLERLGEDIVSTARRQPTP